MPCLNRRVLTRVAAAALAASLAACGGGGDDAGTDAQADASDADVQAYAAPTTTASSDSAAALDSVLLAVDETTASTSTSSATSGSASALAVQGDGRRQAQAASPAASVPTEVTVPVVYDCAGGGTMTLSLRGPTGGLNNQTPDTGEVYTASFAQCITSQQVTLNGEVVLSYTQADSVDSTTDAGTTNTQTRAGTLAATALQVSSPTGAQGQSMALTLNGSLSFQRVLTTDLTSGDQQRNSQYSSNLLSLGLVATRGTTGYELSNLAVTRQVSLQGGELVASQLSGHWQLANTSGRWALSTQVNGSVSYNSSGAPVSGSWSVTRTRLGLTMTAADGTLDVAIDKGADGTVDRHLSLPISQLMALNQSGG